MRTDFTGWNRRARGRSWQCPRWRPPVARPLGCPGDRSWRIMTDSLPIGDGPTDAPVSVRLPVPFLGRVALPPRAELFDLDYLEQGIFGISRFESIDQDGVG